MVHIDPVKIVCNHLIGDNHTKTHKLTIGAFIMIIGVTISKSIIFLGEGSFIIIIVDGIGYLIHGIGAVPYVEIVLKLSRNEHPQ